MVLKLYLRVLAYLLEILVVFIFCYLQYTWMKNLIYTKYILPSSHQKSAEGLGL